MRYKIFKPFFNNLIKKYGERDLLRLNDIKSDLLRNNLYNQLLYYLENDYIRVIYKEFTSFKEMNQEQDKNDNIFSIFLKNIEMDEYIEYIDNKYPLLKKNSSKKIHDYIDLVCEIYNNFLLDKKNIEKNIFEKCGELIDIYVMQGDIHNGKSACKVVTENSSFYYKPINSLNMELFYDVLDLITGNIKELDIKKIKYFSRDTHTWLEEIKYETCFEIDEVKKYYYLSGIYLMIFYIFSSYDMHFENIISNKSTPVIVDFETIAHASTTKSEYDNDFKEVINSILNSAFIPYINDNGAFDINLSGILSETDVSENNESYIYTVDDKYGIKLEKYKSCFYVENQVSLNNENVLEKYITLEEIRKLIRSGFEYASNVIIDNKDKLESIALLYMKNEKLELRQLLRPTQVYHQFIESCKHPDILISEKKQDEILIILESNFTPSSYGYIRVEEEISKLKEGYIPKFYSLGYSKDLYSDGKIICKDYFVESALEMVIKKIRSLDYNQIKYQMRFIDLSILTLEKSDSFGKTTVLKNKKGDIDVKYIKDIIYDLIDDIDNSTIDYGNNFKSIFGPHLTDKKNMWRLRDFSVDIYEDGGVILLLAYYGYTFNCNKSIDLAINLLNYINLFKDDQRITNNSIFTGKGSLLYLNYNLYKVLDKIDIYKINSNEYKQIYYDIANNLLDKIIEKEFDSEDFDFMGGAISSIYFIAKTYLDYSENYEGIKSKLGEITEKIKLEFKYEWINKFGYAHGITGIVVCLSVLYKVTNESDLLIIIKNLLEKENNILMENMVDLNNSWCKGISGILLGRNLCVENILISESKKEIEIKEIEIKDLALRFNDYLYNEKYEELIFNESNLCLCHGLYGNIEVLLRLGAKDKFKEKIYKKYFDSFDNINWVDSLNIPINTFMLANTGIAYVLLEIFYDNIPSILSLDIFE
ncbi:type 2 lantipeptide synthetase LanM [Clostridium sp. Sa3CUN1]|uniref:Type 2 lantipeptide synthetase LanM n=1 Tax=Clostridium gallinarum TaxID=2762246 RepID=A0ABR8Q7L5_9CLOT|nr:type 2 lanthipeptide synthetase LanM [Clostridium gallinarum]MBD7916421.1 type 2 lantipeptide synthetase LanM [Clostridium gallinarum]